ncbi:hypothetical protein HAX54_004343 [Datura stramonium]|uniref:Uncharacterized protein n=1 Tax=Datura stramonium TaxID=4076 RepID=A0ABS8RTQ2_DATST|nr:hypothetical protein [Datura stramonium]
MDGATIVSRGDVYGVASEGFWSKANKIKLRVVTFLKKLKVRRNKLPKPPHVVVAITNSGSPPNCPQIETKNPAPNTKSQNPPKTSEHVVIEIDDPTTNSPFVQNLQKQELSKTLFSVSVPIITGLILFHGEKSTPVVHFTIVGLSTGCTAIINGLLLRKTYPRIANFAEQFGISVILLSFYVQVDSYLPSHLLIVPVLCYGVSVLPFAIAAIQQQGDDNNDDGMVNTQSSTAEVAGNSSHVLVAQV